MNAAKKLEHVSLGGTRSRLSGFRYDDSSTPAEAKTVATAAPLVPSKPERIDSQMVDIRCPCPESNQDIIQLSEAGEEI